MDENKEYDKIIKVEVEDEMRKSYIDYAMSVISARALPDVRDGLKPVHRRILYAMHDLGYTNDKKYRKCANIVGETMGKYHPHGDSSIYNALVNLAQNFSTRYMLVDGQGNFGSIDGDSPAAMRYTEAKMAKITAELLKDINKNTVDFRPNYDETIKEPTVLPSRFPNLLVNGTLGIAVGMATKIPPHNLIEVINGVIKMIDNFKEEERETEIEELLEIIEGPDFPTGAKILGKKGIEDAYRTGRGSIKVRAVCEIQEMKGNKQKIVVSELPYQVNKARLIEKIADLVKNKNIEGISDLRDESDREHQVRIVIELKRDVNANVILNKLYKYTQLQDSYGIIMLALVNGEPKVLSLKNMLTHYLNHQKEVETRRIQYDLDKAEARAHILEGYKIALDNIDEVIKVIRASYNDAEERLMQKFGFSEIQAKAIVDMRLRRLQGLEREKIEKEYAELQVLIAELKSILADEKKLYEVIKERLIEIRDKYGDKRRSEITFDDSEINIEDMIKKEDCVITMTHFGYIKRLPVDTYRAQNRGGRGIKGLNTREEDFIEDLFISNTHSYLMFFTNKGSVYRLKSYQIPESSRTSRGVNIINLLNLDPGERISAVIPINEYSENQYLIMATKNGLIKKTNLMEYKNIRKGGLIAVNLKDNDELIKVNLTEGNEEILLVTTKGMGIRFKETDVRSTGRNTMGVKGINLNSADSVVDMIILDSTKKILVVTEKGLGKRCTINNFTTQNRGGKGIKIHKITSRTGNIVGLKMVSDDDDLMLITSEGIIIRMHVKSVSSMGRVTQGVKLVNLQKDVNVVSIAKIISDSDMNLD